MSVYSRSLKPEHQCEQCSATYTTAVNLRAHVAAKHPEGGSITVMLHLVGKDGSEWLSAAVMTKPTLKDAESPIVHLDEAGMVREGLRVTDVKVVMASRTGPPQGSVRR